MSGSVAMRSAVVRQMMEPMQNSITKPMRDPMDMLSCMRTGIGRMKMAMLVRRLRVAFDHLR